MKLLVDMNLSPQWVPELQQHGWEAVHWSSVGDPRASDRTIMEWAQLNGYTVFTHDLDFGAILAATRGQGPSVFQIRTHDVSPILLAPMVIKTLKRYERQLDSGALISVDEASARARILPLHP